MGSTSLNAAGVVLVLRPGTLDGFKERGFVVAAEWLAAGGQPVRDKFRHALENKFFRDRK
jgi:hypothetical protein